MKEKKSKRSDKTVHIRNLIRGTASVLRAPSTPLAHHDRWRQQQAARKQINDAIALAKQTGSDGEVVALRSWITRNSSDMRAVAKRLGPDLTSLGLLPPNIVAKGLVTELMLATEHLLSRQEQLVNCCHYVSKFEDAFLIKDWEAGLKILDGLSGEHGHSYWGVETRLAVLQLKSGIEVMKSAATSISQSSSGANKFLVYYFGVRNEPAQAASRFKESLKRKLNEAALQVGLKTYFSYRLFGEISLEEKNLASLLAAEQMTSDIDLLFTAIKIVLTIQQNASMFSHATHQATIKLVECVAASADVLGIRFPSKYEEINSPCDIGCLDLCCQLLDQLPMPHDNMLSLACTAVANLLSPSIDGMGKQEQPMIRSIVDGIVSRLSTRSDGVAAEELAKLHLNFNAVPTFLRLGTIGDIEHLPALLLEAYSRGPMCRVLPLTLRDAIICAVGQFWIDHSGPYRESLPKVLNILALAAREMKYGDPNIAVALLLENAHSNSSEIIADTLLVIAAWLQLDSGNETGALSTIAKAGLRNERLVALLPVDEIIRGKRWSTLRGLGPSLALSICLEFCLAKRDDSKIRSYKRFSIEALLQEFNCPSVGKLLEALLHNNANASEVEYLFYKVCDVYTMELLPNMSNSKRVLQDRSELLRTLARVSRANELRYLGEAAEIEEILSVNDGLELLDDSRVYVDEHRILSLINQDLGADFQRYLNLVAAGIGVSESFADVLHSMKNPTAKIFQIPKNDADDLLAEIVFQIREKFLFDPAYGLDIHLSRRIRHGTIASQLRGPLEAAGLIGQRPTAGAPYDPPESVTHNCAHLDRQIRDRAYAAFSRFSEAIDQHIALLRDEYFQIQGPTKPKGLFDVSIQVVLLSLARSVAQTCADVTEFSKECIGLFWFFLSHRVAAGQRQVEIESKKAIKGIFEKLTLELRSAGFGDTILMSHVRKAAEDLRNRISIISSWVRVPNASTEGKKYSMQQIVDISVAVITGQRPGFKPIVSCQLPDDLALDAYGLSVVQDMLYIAFGNVCQHSGKKIDNQVDIIIEYHKDTSLLAFCLRSEVLPSVRTPEKEALLQVIRSKIAKRAFGESARSEGKSGLIKLAALVLQSNKTEISFGFLDDQHFELKFTLAYVAANDALTSSDTAG